MPIHYSDKFKQILPLMEKSKMIELLSRKEDVEIGHGVLLCLDDECKKLVELALVVKFGMTYEEINQKISALE